MQLIIRLCFVCLCIMGGNLFGEFKGRLDVGPTVLSVDMLESGKTNETLNMQGVKGDLTLMVYKALAVKPSFLVARGDGKLASGTIAMGAYLPVKKCYFFPHIAVTWGYLQTHIDLDLGEIQFSHLKERFRSQTLSVGLEFSYCFAPKWTLMGVYQYAWSKTHTKIRSIGSDKSHSKGSNYSIGLEYSIDDKWAVTLGAGYNITLSKEKHGIRGKGVKLGLAYYF
jgi:hypothetical protein